MKKTLVLAMVLAFVVACGIAYAAAPATGPGGQGDTAALRQFQKETLPLRDEIQVKRLEIRDEYAKQTPDQNRIAQLQKEIIDLRAKVRTAADKNGLQGWGNGRGYGRTGYGYGYGAGGRGYGPGMMGYRGGNGYCGGPGAGRGMGW